MTGMSTRAERPVASLGAENGARLARSAVGWPLAAARAVGAALVIGVATPALGQAAFTGLGFFPGGTDSLAKGVSGDGSTVVGTAQISTGSYHAFRWTGSGGLQDLGTLGGTDSRADGVSDDGSIVVGSAYTASPQNHAFRWTIAGGMQDLGTLGGTLSVAYGVSSDGTIVVGGARTAPPIQHHAFRWSVSGGMQDLGALPFRPNSSAYGVSDDGSTVVGDAADNNSGRAFAWTIGAGMQDLGTLGGTAAYASGASGDGTIVVGSAMTRPPVQWHAFRWTAGGGMQDLGTLGGTDCLARGVSNDGSTVVGETLGPPHAFRWTSAAGMQDLNIYLPGLGIDLTGWVLYEASAVSADGIVIVGDGTRNGQREAWMATLCADGDWDGLCDDWEINGIPYTDGAGAPRRYILDADGDGVGDASPLRKDLFVEVDAMQGRTPSPGAIQRVKDAFDAAPVPAPAGVPGGLPGVKLHVVMDPAHQSLMRRGYPGAFTQFQQDKMMYFGTAAERADAANWPMIKEAKSRAYRYCIFAESWGGSRSSGLAEWDQGRGTNDFMVTLGSFWSPAGGSEDDQAGTFMHELGHTLGLGHGGGDGVGFKPNYYSVMNYLWQLPTSWGPGGPQGSFRLVYSDSTLPLLTESALNETAGLQGNVPGLWVPFVAPPPSGTSTTCTFPYLAVPGACINYASFTGGVDWNNDGIVTPGPVTVNVNNFPEDPPALTGTPMGQSLTGYDDWSNLRYDFKGSPLSADGTIPSETPVCLTYDTYVLFNSLPPPPAGCPADFNADGTVNVQDFLAYLNAYATGDPRADFTGDGSVTVQDFLAFLNAYDAGCP